MEKKLTDKSIMQGVIEFDAPDGATYRVLRDREHWLIFELSGNSFVFSFRTEIKGKCTLKKLWRKIGTKNIKGGSYV